MKSEDSPSDHVVLEPDAGGWPLSPYSILSPHPACLPRTSTTALLRLNIKCLNIQCMPNVRVRGPCVRLKLYIGLLSTNRRCFAVSAAQILFIFVLLPFILSGFVTCGQRVSNVSCIYSVSNASTCLAHYTCTLHISLPTSQSTQAIESASQ